MSYSLLNAATQDRYVAASNGGAELLCPSANIIVLTIANAAVLIEFGEGAGTPNYESVEHQLVPGVWTYPRRVQPHLDAVRARSLAPSTPAQVSVSGF